MRHSLRHHPPLLESTHQIDATIERTAGAPQSGPNPPPPLSPHPGDTESTTASAPPHTEIGEDGVTRWVPPGDYGHYELVDLQSWQWVWTLPQEGGQYVWYAPGVHNGHYVLEDAGWQWCSDVSHDPLFECSNNTNICAGSNAGGSSSNSPGNATAVAATSVLA